ncbi:MAG: TlpA family protein disulfide reductase, partial [Armatimonadota bacterium]|nr:TlpA family protein disulfide reductase [Armatimonadota bacterium]
MSFRFYKTLGRLACVLLGLLALTPARADDSPSATDFLKQSMSRYQALTSFQAQCDWSDMFGNKPPATTATRTILYAQPNRFKVVSEHAGRQFVQTSVCDGKRLAEFTNQASLGAQTYPAPSSLAQTTSMQMQHPMFCGSLLYRFFGGPGDLPKLVEASKGPVQYGPDVTLDGEPCRTVLFYAVGSTYGHAQIAIGLHDTLVHRITYDSAPLMGMVSAQMKAKTPMTSLSTEDYGYFVLDQPIADTAFDTALPKGVTEAKMPAAPDEAPPVPLGSMAPDFSVTQLAGGAPIKLSSLRGRTVLLDFWATWCPPCRKSLPETQKLSKEFGGKGLAVMTISDEGTAVIAKFIKANHYTFPTYRDAAGTASKAFKVEAIPTLVVIDKEGHLVAYQVGLQDPTTVRAA